MNTIAFMASEVTYDEAIDGEIVQVSFDEDAGQDPFNRTKRYLMISQNYEFSAPPTVEWHDGKKYNGGAEVLDCKFTKEGFELTTSYGLKFSIQHDCKEEMYFQIKAFLRREFGNAQVT